jgi:hypothetical protein
MDFSGYTGNTLFICPHTHIEPKRYGLAVHQGPSAAWAELDKCSRVTKRGFALEARFGRQRDGNQYMPAAVGFIHLLPRLVPGMDLKGNHERSVGHKEELLGRYSDIQCPFWRTKGLPAGYMWALSGCPADGS